MWYRSLITGKYVRGSIRTVIDNYYGKGTFDFDVKRGILVPLDEDPGVIDILQVNHSISLAAARYREIHADVTLRDALTAVKELKKDLAETPDEDAENVVGVADPSMEE